MNSVIQRALILDDGIHTSLVKLFILKKIMEILVSRLMYEFRHPKRSHFGWRNSYIPRETFYSEKIMEILVSRLMYEFHHPKRSHFGWRNSYIPRETFYSEKNNGDFSFTSDVWIPSSKEIIFWMTEFIHPSWIFVFWKKIMEILVSRLMYEFRHPKRSHFGWRNSYIPRETFYSEKIMEILVSRLMYEFRHPKRWHFGWRNSYIPRETFYSEKNNEDFSFTPDIWIPSSKEITFSMMEFIHPSWNFLFWKK